MGKTENEHSPTTLWDGGVCTPAGKLPPHQHPNQEAIIALVCSTLNLSHDTFVAKIVHQNYVDTLIKKAVEILNVNQRNHLQLTISLLIGGNFLVINTS